MHDHAANTDVAAIDLSSADGTALAVRALQTQGYAILRLPPEVARRAVTIRAVASNFFANDASTSELAVPDERLRDYHTRCGYVVDPGTREFLELHPCSDDATRQPVDAAANGMMRSTRELAAACDTLCKRMLHELIATSVLTDAALVAPSAVDTSAMRVYRYFGADPTSSRSDHDAAHVDVGLLSLLLRASHPGLEILPEGSAEWLPVERVLTRDDEAILFGGAALATRSRIAGLRHRVGASCEAGRVSVAYFLRVALGDNRATVPPLAPATPLIATPLIATTPLLSPPPPPPRLASRPPPLDAMLTAPPSPPPSPPRTPPSQEPSPAGSIASRRLARARSREGGTPPSREKTPRGQSSPLRFRSPLRQGSPLRRFLGRIRPGKAAEHELDEREERDPPTYATPARTRPHTHAHARPRTTTPLHSHPTRVLAGRLSTRRVSRRRSATPRR